MRQECDVLDYNPDTFNYLIKFVENQRVQKWVDRLALRFADENKEKWEKRVSLAKARKNLRLAYQRYERFIDSQSSDNLCPIADKVLTSIFSKIDSIEQIIQVDPDLVNQLATQIEEQYLFSMKLVKFSINLKSYFLFICVLFQESYRQLSNFKNHNIFPQMDLP